MKKNENDVFHLSLTEIAFILILLLVMLLGINILDKRKEIEEQKPQVEKLQKLLNQSNIDVNAPIQNLRVITDTSNLDNEILKDSQQLGNNLYQIYINSPFRDEMDFKEFSRNIEKLSTVYSESDLRNLNLKDLIADNRENLQKIDELEDIINKMKDKQAHVLKLEESLDKCTRNNKYLSKQLRYAGKPPCWLSSSGSTQNLVFVTLYNDYVTVSESWPEEREAEAKKYPEIMTMVRKGTLSYGEFSSLANSFNKNYAYVDGEECRHVVKLRNTIPSRIEGDKKRHIIENYFYKVEVNY